MMASVIRIKPVPGTTVPTGMVQANEPKGAETELAITFQAEPLLDENSIFRLLTFT